MTPQEIFDNVAIHLRDQEGYAEYNNGDSGMCPAYIGEESKKSGIGCLITPDDYSYHWVDNEKDNPDRMLELTNFSIDELIDMHLLSEECRRHMDLLLELDKFGCWENFDKTKWPFGFVFIAAKFNLTYNHLIQLSIGGTNETVYEWIKP